MSPIPKKKVFPTRTLKDCLPNLPLETGKAKKLLGGRRDIKYQIQVSPHRLTPVLSTPLWGYLVKQTVFEHMSVVILGQDGMWNNGNDLRDVLIHGEEIKRVV